MIFEETCSWENLSVAYLYCAIRGTGKKIGDWILEVGILERFDRAVFKQNFITNKPKKMLEIFFEFNY